MNGSNSNTSGNSVANVGFWPSGVYQAIVNFLGNTLASFRKVLSGEEAVAAVDFSATAATDLLSDAVMEEIARRLIVTMERAADSNVVFSPEPPTDKSKVWWQIDAATGIPIGQPKLWNATALQWVSISQNGSNYVPPRHRFGRVFATAGASSVNLDFADLGTVDYMVVLTPTTYLNGAWGSAPNTFPTHFGWTITNKTNNQVNISFYGTPTGGLNFEVDIIERTDVTVTN